MGEETVSPKQKVAQAKHKIKAWEGEYKAAYGCRPDKEAMALAPDDIKYAYKMYRYYRRALEKKPDSCSAKDNSNMESQAGLCDTDMDSLNSDGKLTVPLEYDAVGDGSQCDHKLLKDVLNTSITGASDHKGTSNSGSQMAVDDLRPTPTGIKRDDTWGSHLNKRNHQPTAKHSGKETSLYSKMAEKLRANSTIKLRTSLNRPLSVNKKQSKVVLHTLGQASQACSPPGKDDVDSMSSEDRILNRRDIDNNKTNTAEVIENKCSTPTPGNGAPHNGDEINTAGSGRTGILVTLEEHSSIKTFPKLDCTTQQSEGTSAFDTLEPDTTTVFPRMQRTVNSKNAPSSQPISALSVAKSLTPAALPSIRKRASLNLGWVARCTGSDLEADGIPNKPSIPPDSWKMKLIDKEWHQDEDDEECAQESPFVEEQNGQTSPMKVPPTKAKCAVKRTPGNDWKKQARNNVVHKEDAHPKATVKSPARSRGTALRKRAKTQKTSNCDESSEVEDDVEGCRGGRSNEDEAWQGCEGAEPNNTEEINEHGNGEHTSASTPASSDVCVRKRRVQTIEELEESGKLQSQWPPPKKKRIARNKPTIAKRRKPQQVNQELPNVPQKVNVKATRKNAKEQDEEGGLPSKPGRSNVGVDYDETDDIEAHGTKNTKMKSRYLSSEERLQKKVSSGTLNNNYVRINLKKKVFVRGKKTMTGGKYKRQEWKKKMTVRSAESGNAEAMKKMTCFRCGDFGHWARDCPGKVGDKLTPLEDYDEKESTFLSLEEAESMALGIKTTDSATPVSKMYPKVSESKEAKAVTVEVQNDEMEACGQSSPESHEKHGEEHDTDSVAVDHEAEMSQSVSKAHHVTEDTEYDFNDSDDDIFADMGQTDGMEDQQQSQSSTSCLDGGDRTVPQPLATPGCNRPTVEPLYPLRHDEVGPTPEEVYDVLHMFGYPSFRPGQEAAIMRILSGQSTLLVLSTGSGKSLCYQLPAYLYAKHRSPCITLCVSPLVSLMEDQVTGLPGFLRAVCLHTHQNQSQRSQALAAIHSKAAHILLVSPEAVVASRAGGVLGTLLKELPPVAFACLDEAHCVSEWSHNFRPSYLRVCQVLRERLGVRTILGLTATARRSTGLSIARHLRIPDFDTGVICGTFVPDNLQLSVSRDRHREEALVALLQGERFGGCSSIIVYCTRRDECERIATLIRTQLLDPAKVDVKSNLKRGRSLSLDAEAYHAGLSSHRRQQVQKRFMSGKLRIVVATVAFGMGIDKSDVRGIIHFNMPKNVESYVQEIGRAGRDGSEAHCHLFLDDQDGRDIQELKRHIYANAVDRHTIRKLLTKIFKPCTCVKLRNLSSADTKVSCDEASSAPASPVPASPHRATQGSPGRGMAVDPPDPFTVATARSSCPRHEVAIPIETVVEELDLPEENLETLLCYLELYQGNLITINSHVYANCTVSCYGGPRQLVAVSRCCPPLAVAIALERQKGVSFVSTNRVSFPVIEISSRMGWNSKIVKRELKSLEWDSRGLNTGGKVKRSGVTVELTDLSFHLEVRGDLTDDERDLLLDAVYRRTQTQEQDQLRQLHYTYQLLRSVSHSTILFCCDSMDGERCTRLRTELREYFRDDAALSDVQVGEKPQVKPEVEAGVRSSVRAFLSTYHDQQWTGRAVARVFHGIGSPNFPTEVWGRVRRFWRQHLNTDFNVLVAIATQEILRCK